MQTALNKRQINAIKLLNVEVQALIGKLKPDLIYYIPIIQK